MEYKKNDSVKSNAGGKWKSVFEGKIDSVTFNKHKGIFSYNVIFPAQHGEEEFECDLKAKYIFTDNNGKCKKRNGETIKSSSSSSSRKKRKPCKKLDVSNAFSLQSKSMAVADRSGCRQMQIGSVGRVDGS